MNKLDEVIIDQYKRVEAWKGEPLDVLQETQGEILAAATPELTLEILEDLGRIPDRERRSSNAQTHAFMYENSITSRMYKQIQIAHKLGDLGMLVPEQGYVGGIIRDGNVLRVFGNSSYYRGVKPDDPIQAAMGKTFYPPMMWAKAIRGVAYGNRPASAADMSVSQYSAKLGLSLGAMVTEYGDVVGATGFMPGPRLQGSWGSALVDEHIQSEPVEAFRLSGLCDQAVLEIELLRRTPEFAEDIIARGGSLN